jgi:hypothetical protein
MCHVCMALIVALAVSDPALGGARRQLFSDPSKALPDVWVSETTVSVAEGGGKNYTLELTHPPGMREDGTVRDKALPPLSCLSTDNHCGDRWTWTTTKFAYF